MDIIDVEDCDLMIFITNRRIKKGEELFINYNKFDAKWRVRNINIPNKIERKLNITIKITHECICIRWYWSYI